MMGAKFGTPPSYWMEIDGPLERYLYDAQIFHIGNEEERRAQESANRKSRMRSRRR